MTVTPYLTFKDAAAAIDFYARVFGAEELSRLADPSGRIGHAEIRIGETTLMLSDEAPASGAFSPITLGGSPIRLHLSVNDADATGSKLIAAGATVLREIKNEFYGERIGLFADPFGYHWFVASKCEDVNAEEAQQRWSQTFS